MNYYKFPCPCCGYLTFSEVPSDTYLVCPVCYWEDDAVQYNDIDYAGGANKQSLRVARKNYKKFGAMSSEFIKQVRPPFPDEIPE